MDKYLTPLEARTELAFFMKETAMEIYDEVSIGTSVETASLEAGYNKFYARCYNEMLRIEDTCETTQTLFFFYVFAPIVFTNIFLEALKDCRDTENIIEVLRDRFFRSKMITGLYQLSLAFCDTFVQNTLASEVFDSININMGNDQIRGRELLIISLSFNEKKLTKAFKEQNDLHDLKGFLELLESLLEEVEGVCNVQISDVIRASFQDLQTNEDDYEDEDEDDEEEATTAICPECTQKALRNLIERVEVLEEQEEKKQLDTESLEAFILCAIEEIVLPLKAQCEKDQKIADEKKANKKKVTKKKVTKKK